LQRPRQWLLSVCRCLLVYVANDNQRLKKSLAIAIDGMSSSTSACVLPELVSATASKTQVDIGFPRAQPLLLLSSRSTCPYCKTALQSWTAFVAKHPELDHFVYDGTHSYTLNELQQHNVDPATVLISRASVAPYNDLLTTTPTVILVGRTGRVLGLWSGELSTERMKVIDQSVSGLLAN